MSKYRLLDDGEIIQEGDEFFSTNTLSWENVKAYSQGETYFEDDDLPMRRPIEGEPASEQKGLPVRIAVAVDPKTGKWNAAGWELDSTRADLGRPTDREKMDDATSLIEGEAQRHWVTAVIPITEPPVIHGRVEADDG